MRSKRLHGQTYLPWRLSSGYDPNPPAVLQALLESLVDNRHTSEQRCSLQLRQHCAQSKCSVLWRLRPMTSYIINAGCLSHLADLLNKSRDKVLSAQTVGWFLIYRLTFQAVWGEKLKLKSLVYIHGKSTVVFQVHHSLFVPGSFCWCLMGDFLSVWGFLLVFVRQ